jgi:hypothetical protein
VCRFVLGLNGGRGGDHSHRELWNHRRGFGGLVDRRSRALTPSAADRGVADGLTSHLRSETGQDMTDPASFGMIRANAVLPIQSQDTYSRLRRAVFCRSCQGSIRCKLV